MKIHFTSFAGGNGDYRASAMRIRSEAYNCGYFDEIHVCDDETAYPILKMFLSSQGDTLKSRGFGFWSWKPHLLLDVMEMANVGDIICYADSGCQISPLAGDKFEENIRICNKEGSVFFHLLGYPIKHWTKKRMLEYFECLDDINILNTPQIHAGYFYILVSQENKILINTWADVCKAENLAYIDDSESYGVDNTFVEHRHDQSALSILVTKNGMKTRPDDCTFSRYRYYINSPIMLFPVHCVRSRSGTTKYLSVFKNSRKEYIKTRNPTKIFINGILLVAGVSTCLARDLKTRVPDAIKDYLYQKIKKHLPFLKRSRPTT